MNKPALVLGGVVILLSGVVLAQSYDMKQTKRAFQMLLNFAKLEERLLEAVVNDDNFESLTIDEKLYNDVVSFQLLVENDLY